MSTDTIDTIISVDFEQSLEDMIAAGRYDRINPYITPKRFRVEGTGTKFFRTRLFHFDRYVSSEMVVAAMQKGTFAPATLVHGLAYAAIFPYRQRTFPIACLGSSARWNGDRDVVCLGGDAAARGIDLGYWDSDWGGLWCFLGVQEVSAA